MIRGRALIGCFHLVTVCGLLGMAVDARGELRNPVLHTVFPVGGRAGTTVTITVDGSDLDGLRDVYTPFPRSAAKKVAANRFALTIPAETPPGVYDLRVVGTYGMSSPRAFFVSNRLEEVETEPNDQLDGGQQVSLDVVVNGRIDKPGDLDCYRFAACAGQRVVLECWAERLDSQLRAVLEVYDLTGKRLAVNRGHTGVDPLVDFLVPANGTYVAKVFDLSYLGGAAFFYRLDIDTKPRVEFALPCVVTRGRKSQVKLFGRNLLPTLTESRREGNRTGLDCVEVEVSSQRGRELLPLPLRPAQLTAAAVPCYYPGGHAPVPLGVTDVPVVAAAPDNRSAQHAQEIEAPCEVSGQLTKCDERHWYAVRARRGEVLWLEAFGERIGSPVDLDVAVLDPAGRQELAKLTDSLENLGGYRFPTNHLDPGGRWVAPADGRYVILLRTVTGGLRPDPRRVYRLSVRREEPDFELAVVSRRTDQPAGLNLWRGGREMAEVIAVRRRGMAGAIRVTPQKLPPGVQCPEVWIGPGQDRVPLVLTASHDAPDFAGALHLEGRSNLGSTELVRPARGGTMIWPGRPFPSGRLTQEVPLAIALELNLHLTATAAETVVYQDSVLEVAVEVGRSSTGSMPAVTLKGIGLPREAVTPTATIPAGRLRGWIGFTIPAKLPPGPYTVAVQAETEASLPSGKGSVTLVSNPITAQVRPARIRLELDPQTPRKIARGKIIRLRFTAERKDGFIGKIHTELVAPGGVAGLRARGVTLVGQTDSGEIQVIATEDAPLGRQPFLRLDAVGTVEDQPVFRASRLVDLEITE